MRRVVPLFLLGLLTIALLFIYLPGTAGPFQFDDYLTLVDNPRVMVSELSWTAVRDAVLSSDTGPLGRPLSMLSFALDFFIAGRQDPFPIKFGNLWIHLLTTVGLFGVSLHLVRLFGGKGRSRAYVALLMTALWALHPLWVSSVLYAVQRMTLLSALFSAYGVLAYLHGRQRLREGRGSGLWWVLGGVVVGGGLAVLSKENGALLVFYLLAIEVVLLRFSFHEAISKRVKAVAVSVVVAPALSILGYLSYLAFVALSSPPTRSFGVGERLLTEARALFFYLSELLFPHIGRMGLFHDDFVVSRGWLTPATTLPSVIGILLLVGVAWYGARRPPWRPFAFAIAWFLGGHLLESTVVQLEPVFEHRNYLPAFGIMAAVGWYLSRAFFRGAGAHPVIRIAFVLVVPLALAVQLDRRVEDWSSGTLFWESELRSHPESPRVWGSIGWELARKGLLGESEQAYRKSAELARNEAGYLLELWSLKRDKGLEVEEWLVGEVVRRLREGPLSTHETNQLFLFCKELKQGQADLDQAERALVSALSNPYWRSRSIHGFVRLKLGQLHLWSGRKEEGESDLREAIPELPEPLQLKVEKFLSSSSDDRNWAGAEDRGSEQHDYHSDPLY